MNALKNSLFILFVNASLSASPAHKADEKAAEWAKTLQEKSSLHEEWVMDISKRADDPHAINWVKEYLKNDLQIATLKSNSIENLNLYGEQKCFKNALDADVNSSIYVLMSFSVPAESWASLSKELEKIGGVFVLQGIPDNSFKALSKKVISLNDLGVTAPIQINPMLFREFDVHVVPTIIVRDEHQYDKIVGNISLFYALQKMALEGDAPVAKKLLNQLGEKP